MKGNAQRGAQMSFGTFGIKALEEAWITSRQIEAARVAVTRYMKREGQLWIRIFPDKPVTKKPAEVRMGKGKGSPEYYVAVVRPGRILFEIDDFDTNLSRVEEKLDFIVQHIVDEEEEGSSDNDIIEAENQDIQIKKE